MPGRRTAPTRAQAGLSYESGVPNITPLAEGPGDWVKAMIFSHPGWGKTALASTAAEFGRTLIVRSSLDSIPSIAIGSGADEVICDTHEAMIETGDFLAMSDHKYVWVFWDNISIAQDVLLDDIWSGTLAEKPGRGFITNDQGQSTGRPNMSPTSGLDRGEYGRNMERMQQWVRRVVGCQRFHFGIMAHAMDGPHPANAEANDLLVPAIQGKNMPQKICGYMNMVGFLDLEETAKGVKRMLYFKETPRYYAKDLFDAFLPDGTLENPTIKKLMKAVNSAKKHDEVHAQTTTAARRGRRTS